MFHPMQNSLAEGPSGRQRAIGEEQEAHNNGTELPLDNPQLKPPHCLTDLRMYLRLSFPT